MLGVGLDVYLGSLFPPEESVESGGVLYPSNAVHLSVSGTGDLLLPHLVF